MNRTKLAFLFFWRQKLSAWAALSLAALVACGQQEPAAEKEGLPLAKVGTELITDRDLEYLIDNVAQWAESEQEGTAKVREYLQSLVDRALILQEARAGKLDRNPAFANEVATALRRLLVRQVEKGAIEDQVSITEEEMQRVFAEDNWQRWIKIAHIVAPTQERAAEAMVALRSGRPFADVARQFSTHSRTASQGGVKPSYFSRFHAYPLVRDILFNLEVGAYSEPLVVPQGYEIFKVLDEKSGTYEQTREFLLRTLSKERMEARQKAYTDSLAEVFALTPDPPGLSVLMGVLRGGRVDEATQKMTFHIPEGASKTPLYLYEGGQISLGDGILQSPAIRQGRDVADSAKVIRYLEKDVVRPQLIWLEAKKLELDRQLEDWVKRKEEEVLIVAMRQIVVSTDEEISEEEVRQHYEETKEQFRTASQVSVVEVQLASEAEAEALLGEIRDRFKRAQPLSDLLARLKQQTGADLRQELQAALQPLSEDQEVHQWLRKRLNKPGGTEAVLEEIASDASPKELAEEYIMRQLAASRSLRPGSRKTEGHYHLYWYETARFGALVPAAMEGQVGSLIGPLQVGPAYSVAKILSRQESTARPFEERQRKIRTEIKKERESQSFGLWLKDLRASYRDEVRFFDENIEQLARRFAAQGREQAARSD